MKVLQRILDNKLFIISIIFYGALIFRAYAALFPQNMVIVCDNTIAHPFSDAIKKECAGVSVRSLGVKNVYTHLKKHFPFLSDITISYKGSSVAYVHLATEQPRIRLKMVNQDNKKYLLTAQGRVMEEDYFSSDFLENLPCVSVEMNSDQFKNPHIGTSLLAMGPEVFDSYKVTLRSKNEVLLHSYAHKNLVIISDITSVHYKNKLVYAHKIYEKKVERDIKKGISIDIRHKDVLVYRPQGEQYYEKSIRV